VSTASVATYPHISKKPGVCGGKACIAGTRIRVMDIVALLERGLPPERMLEHYSSRPLTLAEVHSALGYYYDHRDEIEADLRSDENAKAEHDAGRLRQSSRGPAR